MAVNANLQAENQAVGKVTILYGTVKAISPDSNETILALNSTIFANDRIITESDGKVSIIFDDPAQTQLDLGRMSEVVLDEDVYSGTTPESIEELAAEIEEIQEAILAEGIDPTTVLEAPAAGGTSSAGGGHPVPEFQDITPEGAISSGAETEGITSDTVNPIPAAIEAPQPSVSVSINAEGGEVPEGEDAIFTVTVTDAIGGSDLVLSLTDSSADSPADYHAAMFEYNDGSGWRAVEGPITLKLGTNTFEVRTDTVLDNIDESDEDFSLNAEISNLGTPLASDSATAIIVDGDEPIVIVSDDSAIEGENEVFTVTVNNAAEGAQLTLGLQEGSADDAADYHATTFQYSTDDGGTWQDISGSITLSAGASTLLVRTDTVVDDELEGEEDFFLYAEVTNEGGAPVFDTGEGIIIDGTPEPEPVEPVTIEVTDDTIQEGDNGEFTVTINDAPEGVQLDLNLSEGTADDPFDYHAEIFEYNDGSGWQAVSGPITLTEGTNIIQVRTDTVDDDIDEPNETFFLNASVSDTEGELAAASGTGTIIDNDVPPPPVVSVSPGADASGGTITEGEDAHFTVTVTDADDGDTLSLSLSDGSADSPADYHASTFQYSTDGGSSWFDLTGPIALEPGSNIITVRTDTVDDDVDEPNEIFTLNATVNNADGPNANASGVANILDNDDPGVDIDEGVGVEGVTVTEGEDAVFHVTVANAAAGATLDLNLTDGSADSPADYTSATFTYNLGDGSGDQTYTAGTPITLTAGGDYDITVTVSTVDDIIHEDTEYFTLNASVTKAEGGTVDDTATGNILDDNDPPDAVDDFYSTTFSEATTNIVLVLDTSGSMDGDPLTLTKAAVANLIETYGDSLQGVMVVEFSTDASVLTNGGNVWMSGPDAITQINGLDATGWTDYDDAIYAVRDNYNGVNGNEIPPDADNTFVYFLSDGDPRPEDDPDSFIQADDRVAWETFLTTEDINEVYAVGIGDGVTTTTYLSSVAWNPGGNDMENVITVDSFDDLSGTLENIAAIVHGSILDNDTDPENDPLSVTHVNGTLLNGGPADDVFVLAKGTLSISENGEFSFTPNQGATGDQTFQYTISDGYGGTDTATVTISINNPPDAVNDPAAGDDAITTPENTPIDINVLANDSDPDGNPLTVTSVTDPANGTTAINPDGTVEYTPDPGWTGTETFDYTISDGEGGTDTASVTVTVLEAPEALPDSDEVTEGSPTITGNLLANDSPADATLTIVNGVTVAAAGWTEVSNDAAGVLRVNADGDYEFDVAGSVSNPGGAADLVKTLNYTIEDQYGSTGQSNLTINIHDTAPQSNDVDGIQIYFHSEDAGYDNVVGIYQLDGNGNPVNPQIIVESTDDLQNQAGDELVFTTNDPTIKLFIIANGANQISNVGSASFGFSVSGDNVTLLVNGSAYTSSEIFYMNQAWNSDGEPHIAAIPPGQTTGNAELPGWNNPNGPALSSIPDPVVGETIFIGIEDLLGGSSDHDFNDAVLYAKGIAPTVDESALSTGTGGGNLTAGGNLLADHNIIPGEDTVSVTFGGQTVVLDGSGASKTATTPLGNELTIAGNGNWIYTLKTNTDHPDTDPAGDGDTDRGVDDQVQENINIQVQDSDGSTAPSISLKIDINDDGPEIGSPGDTLVTNDISFLQDTSLDIDFGADGFSAASAIQLDGQTNGDGFVIDNDGNVLQSSGQNLVFEDDGSGGLIAKTAGTGDTVFTVAVNADTGNYTVDMIKALDNIAGESVADSVITFGFEAVDGDGDVAIDTFDLSIDDLIDPDGGVLP